MRDTKENKWIIQQKNRSIYLGFSGEECFVNKSVNFCYNYGVADSEKNQVKSLNEEKFKYIKTKPKKLVRALNEEGRVLKIRSLVKVDENIDLTDYEKEIKLAGRKHCRRECEKIKKGTVIRENKSQLGLEEIFLKNGLPE
jgi:hypothetical protein